MFDICLLGFKLGVSSWGVAWEVEGAVHVREGFLDMLKSRMWQNSCFGESLQVDTYCIYDSISDLLQVPGNVL